MSIEMFLIAIVIVLTIFVVRLELKVNYLAMLFSDALDEIAKITKEQN